jgi:hypothetical protein
MAIPPASRAQATNHEIPEIKYDLRNEFLTSVAALEEKIGTRLDAMDKATVVLEANVNRVPTLLDREIKTVRDLFEQMFSSGRTLTDERIKVVDEHIKGLEKLADALQANADKAIGAAFSAADKAVVSQYTNFNETINKMTASTTKEIDGIKALLSSTKEQLSADIGNLTGRLDRGEGMSRGGKDAAAEGHASIATIVSIVVAAVAVLSLILTFTLGEGFHTQIASQQVAQPAAIAVAPIAPSALQGAARP